MAVYSAVYTVNYYVKQKTFSGYGNCFLVHIVVVAAVDVDDVFFTFACCFVMRQLITRLATAEVATCCVVAHLITRCDVMN